MRNLLPLFVLALLAAPALAQKGDKAGCKDDPLFPVRMPNYRIEKCESKSFAAFELKSTRREKKSVEGQHTFIQYTVDRKEDDRTGVEVVRNYENALKKIGGRVHDSDTWWLIGVVQSGGREVWAQVQRGNGKIWLDVVRKQEMTQIVVADAAALANDLKTTGHVTVNGIYFDTNKAALKPESAQAVGEIVQMLEADPALKVFVVGHTDTVGTVAANLTLSEARAASVVAALTREGIAATRLQAFGNGPFAPVATNATEAGRAQNRRVELVRQ
jgi:OOP family OmpA-OmpF porin